MLSVSRVFPSGHFLLWLFIGFTVSVRIGLAQDSEAIKQKVLSSHLKIEKYPAALVKGKYVLRERTEYAVSLQMRGDKMWIEGDSFARNEPLEKQAAANKVVREIMGAGEFPLTIGFDGKNLYEFAPDKLTLTVKSVKSVPSVFSDSPFLPTNWVRMAGNRNQFFRNLVEGSEYETKVEQLDTTRWKLSQTGLGSRLPDGGKNVDIQERYVIVDAKCDYLVTEYQGNGFQGKLEGQLEWSNQDGNWYARHGKQLANGKPLAEWTVDEISFDAKKCRSQFDNLESLVPFATKVMTLDQKSNLLSTRFKGGNEGETEHNLRELALRMKQSAR
jgi:hypothetical protein